MPTADQSVTDHDQAEFDDLQKEPVEPARPNRDVWFKHELIRELVGWDD